MANGMTRIALTKGVEGYKSMMTAGKKAIKKVRSK